MKHLYKSKTNKVFAGIVGGVAEFFEIDPTIIRLVWVLIVIFTGFFPGVVAYIIAMLIVPDAPSGTAGAHSQEA